MRVPVEYALLMCIVLCSDNNNNNNNLLTAFGPGLPG